MQIENTNVKCYEFKTIVELRDYIDKTDTGKANHFYEHVKEDIKLSFSSGKKVVFFYYDNVNKLWVESTEQCYRTFVCYYFDNTIKYIVDKCKPHIDFKDLKVVEALLQRMDKTAFHNTIIDRCNGLLQDDTFITKLNNNPHYFAIRDGKKINLQTLEITDRTKDDYFYTFSDVAYVEETPNANKFFNSIQPNEENREYLRKCMGYNLTGDTTAQVFFIWYGSGANGKSELGNLMQKILGNLYEVVNPSVFVKTSGDEDKPKPFIMALMNKRMGVMSEGDTGDNIEFNNSQVKRISGEETIKERSLFKEPIEFKIYIKLNMLTNFVPNLDADPAIVRRLKYIYFDSEFKHKPDKSKSNEFLRDEQFINDLKKYHMDEVFSWVVKGSKEYYKTKSIEMTEEFKDRTTMILQSDDSIEAFIKHHLIITNDAKEYIRKGDIFRAYEAYCDGSHGTVQKKKRNVLFQRLDNILKKDPKEKNTLDGYDIYRKVKFNIKNSKTETKKAIINDENEALEDENKALKIELINMTNKYENLNMKCNKALGEEYDLELNRMVAINEKLVKVNELLDFFKQHKQNENSKLIEIKEPIITELIEKKEPYITDDGIDLDKVVNELSEFDFLDFAINCKDKTPYKLDVDVIDNTKMAIDDNDDDNDNNDDDNEDDNEDEYDEDEYDEDDNNNSDRFKLIKGSRLEDVYDNLLMNN